MRWVKRIAWGIGGLVVVLAVTVVIGVAWLNSDAGRAWLQATANQALAGEARLTALAGRPPFHLAAGRLDLLDEEGVWARLEDVHLDIAPWDLLRRRLTIARLSAATAEMLRRPVGSTQPETSSFALPPVAVDVQRLTLTKVGLPPEVFGEPTTWTAVASGSWIGQNLALRLDVSELDPAPVRLDARFELSDARANAHATLEDPRGLLLRRATGEPLPLRIVVADDDGRPQEPADWHGRLTASIGDRARLDATLHLAVTGGDRVLDTDGEFDGARLLPVEVAPLVSPTLAFHLAARELAGTGWSLDGVRLRSDAFEAKGTGTYRTRGDLVDASLHLAVPDLARFAALAGDTMAGSAGVVIAAKGPLDALHAELDAHGAHVAYGANTIDDVAARFALAASPRGDRFDGEGTLAGLRSGGAALPAHLGDAMHWKLAGTSDPTFTTASLTSFTVASAGTTLAGDASLDARTRRVAGTARLDVDDLSHLDDIVPGLRGRAHATAAIDGTLSGAAHVRLQAALDDLATGLPAADALLDGQLRLEAELGRDEAGVLTLARGSARGAAVRLTASGRLDPATDELGGDFTGAADDLAVLRRAGVPAQGRLALRGRVAGHLAAPALDAHLDGTNLGWQTARIDRAALDVHATSEGAPAARVSGELRARDLRVELAAQANLSRDRKTLTVPRLRLASGPNVIAARLRTALDTLLTDGEATATLPDLKPLSPLAGLALGGRLDLKAGLAARQGEAADVTLRADDVSAAAPGAVPMRVHRLTATGSLTGLLRHPMGRLGLTARDVSAAGADLHALRLSAHAEQPDRFAFDGTANGDFKGPFAVAAAGRIGLARGATRITVESLTGETAGTPLRLERPLVVTSQGVVLTVADLGLAIGDGRVEGRVRRDATNLEVALDAERLPLHLAAHFAGRDDISGIANATIVIAGPARQPHGRIALRAANVQAGAVARGAPSVGFAAEASLAARRVDVNATAEVGGTHLLSVAGTVPVEFGPQPGGFALAETRPLDLTVEGSGELARLAAFLPLAGDRAAGRIRMALHVTGTPAEPEIGGNLSLTDGHFEDLESGLVVDGLDLDVGADHDRLVLRHLSATDGDKGRLAGSGSVSFGRSTSSDLTVSLTKFQALRRSDASLTASGSATLAGSWTAPVLVARLTVDRGEFFLTEPPPPGAQKIPVTVIDSATGQVLSRPAPPSEPAGTSRLRLDVTVHVPGNTFVRGRGLDSEWRGDVHAQGSAAAPELTGSLQVVRGTFSFFGKDMNLARGTVAFTGGHKIAPDLDVLARTTTADAIFNVAVTGTPDDLKIKLSSTPAMPEDQILSRLIFGRDVTKLSPAEGLQLAQAAATLSGGGPGMLDRVRQKLGLDVLNIGNVSNTSLPGAPTQPSSSTSQSSGAGNTGISGGKYIANGVYVGAVQGLSGETRSRVEVQVLPHVRLESQAGTRSEQFGVNWQLDY